MIIAISGLAGSGKTTVGRIVAEKLGLKIVSPSFKDIAKEKGITLMEVQRRAEKDDGTIDRDFDAIVKKEINRGDCVITTWLGPWLIPENKKSIKVWLHASKKVRGGRLAKREQITFEKAIEHITKREASNEQRYMRYYGIDIHKHDMFDITINTEYFKPTEIAEIIIFIAKLKFAKRPTKSRGQTE